MVKKKQDLRSNQEGVVSILVTIILILIMTLVVLAMSQNANREQRQALDRQLSDQAYYNAESGINDTADYLYRHSNDPITSLPLDHKTSCANPFTVPVIPTRTIGGAGTNNSYTCVFYDKAPETIQFDQVSISTPKVVPILPYDQSGGTSVALGSLTISWDDATDRGAAISGCAGPSLPPSCGYGGVRFELVRIGQSRDAMRSASSSGFLLPDIAASSNVLIGAVGDLNNQGILKSAACTAVAPTNTRRCSATITGTSGSNFYISLRSLYRPTNISISGKDTSNNPVRFKDAQIMIDVTGKAADVLRRLQVRLPAKSQYDYPGFALQTKESICKTLRVSLSFAGVGSVDSSDPTDCPASPAP